MDALYLFKRVSDRYQTAISFHRENADLFRFLALPGFAALHEYQVIDETNAQRSIKRFVIDNYGVIYTDANPDNVNMLDPLLSGVDKYSMDNERKWRALQSSWSAYRDWEVETKEVQSEAAKILLDNGFIHDYTFMSALVDDVSSELVKLEAIMLDMRNTDFDMPHIQDMQTPLCDEYRKKLKHIKITL